MNKFLKFWPLIPLFLFSLTPLLWFYQKGDILINGVDTNFPLDPQAWFLRRFFVWNSVLNAGSDFSSSTAGLFFHLIQFIPYRLGFSLQQVQLISLIFWFFLIVFGAFIFARVLFVKKTLIQFLFVSFYSFNIYLFNTWENIKVANLSLMAAIPLAVTILLLLYQKQLSYAKGGFYSLLLGVVLSGTGINPAYFISFMLVILMFFFGQISFTSTIRSFLDKFKVTIFVMGLILLANMFWILPTTEFILRSVPSSQSLAKIGFTNWLIGLSENTSLLNVLRLQGVWDWYAFDLKTNEPLYIPYVSNYFSSLPFVFFSFLTPLLAILSFIFHDKQKKSLYAAFGLMFVMGVFLGAGAHYPTGALFLWLTNHVPFFTLLRSPWYIFTPLLILSTAALVCLFLYHLDAQFRQKRWVIGSYLLPVTILLLIVATLLYSYSLIRGDIFRPEKKDGFYIMFPQYIFDAQRWLSQNREGRIVSFSDENVEMFKWGYRGIDSVLALLVDREVLFTPFQGDDHFVARLIREFFLSLKKGELEAAKAIAEKLNANLIFSKKDQVNGSGELQLPKDGFMTQVFGEWSFIAFPKEGFIPKIFSPEELFWAYPYLEGNSILPALKGKSALLNPEDSVVKSVPAIISVSKKIILAENSQAQDVLKFEIEPGMKNRLLVRDLSHVTFNFEIPVTGAYQPVLERYGLENFGIDITKNLGVELDGKPVLWDIVERSDSFVRFSSIDLTEGRHKAILKLTNGNLIQTNFIRGGEGRDMAVYELVGSDGNQFLSILNTNIADADASWRIVPFDQFSDYYIEVRYKQIYGKNAKALVTQTGDSVSKNQVEHLPNYPEWRSFSFYFRPSRVNSVMDVKLIASAVNDPLGTKVAYDDLRVQRVFSNKLLLMGQREEGILTSPELTSKKMSPVQYEGEIRGAEKPHLIIFSENYTPQWELVVYDMNGAKLKLQPTHFSANLYANAWYLKDTPQKYKFKIYYKPQRLFILGLVAFTTAAVVSIFALVFSEVRKRRRKQ